MAQRSTKKTVRQESATDMRTKDLDLRKKSRKKEMKPVDLDQPITIKLKEFLKLTGIARSTAFEMWNPRSKRYDEAMPVGFRLSDSKNAPRFFFYWDVVEWLQYRAELWRSRHAGKRGVLAA
ncbi:hypothetical protein ABQJ54_10900 [Rhodanobacter sp. Si-c]|jgi:hypothetical protein|uniref:AlpA family phage regulatory protein n=1 Tax=Rhodanobacter lycopersici TaxID=3162487 RepID=A0ABV3QEZ5_9GAMM